jgi:LPS O-antigen subunit length determinant protein (WzzB/FepE family)
MSRIVWTLTLSGLLTASACERTPADRTPGKVTSQDVRRDAGKAVDTAVEFSQQSKEEFQKNLDARLKQLDVEIVRLREKGRDLNDEAKANWERKMAELEAKREAARARLSEVGQSSAEAWKDVQKGAQSAWDELEKAFREASNEF